MTLDRIRGWLVPLVAACLVGFTAQNAAGQGTVVTGKVTNDHGAAVAGASVAITSLHIGAVTNEAGNYTITVPDVNARGQTVSVETRYIGYTVSTSNVTLTPGSHTLDISLKPDIFHLNTVVTTGVADSTSAATLTFSEAKVEGSQIAAVPAANPLQALAGRIAGVQVSEGTGNPGADPAIRIRGSTCLQVGCSTPLIIVDGVITTESISDIDANDIQSIEVIPGAAGASFYGSAAANGVISITTKSGSQLAENHVTITGRTEYGNSGIPHWPAANTGTTNSFVNGLLQVDPSGDAISNTIYDSNPYPTSGPYAYRNQMKVWLSNNDYYNNVVSVGLRRGNTNFMTEYSSDHNGGILPFKRGQFRQNVRLNVDQGVGSKLDFSTSITYGNQNNDYPTGSSTGFFDLYQASPMVNLAHPFGVAGDTVALYSKYYPGDTTLYFPVMPTWSDKSARANPLYDLWGDSYNLNRQRLLGSVAGNWRPTDWLRFNASYGTDRLTASSTDQQAITHLNSTNGNQDYGHSNAASTNDISWNSMLRATATKLYHELLSTTSVAYQMENDHFTNFSLNGGILSVGGITNTNNNQQSQLTTSSGNQIERTTDYMISEDLNLKDRYLLSGLYRRDGSSLFGSNARWNNFYRISGAYIITQDFHIPGFQQLKVHVAQGTAGLRPDYSYQYQTYSISNGKTSPVTLGNTNLKDAVLTETEYGINAQFLDRFAATLDYAHRVTNGAFLDVPLSAAEDGFSSKWENAADILSKSLDASLQVSVVNSRNFSYDLTLTGDHTTQQITSMNAPPTPVNAGGQGQGIFYYQAGKPLGIIYGNKFVHSCQELQVNPAADLSGIPGAPTGTVNCSDYAVNSAGYLVLKDSMYTKHSQAIFYHSATGQSQFVIGNVNPSLTYGWQNDFRWGQFTAHLNFDGQVGGNIYNFNKQWQTQDLFNPDMNMVGKDSLARIPENFFTGNIYNGLNPDAAYVESGAYLKLQEFAIGYDVPTRWLPKIGLGAASGLSVSLLARNVYTWTSYDGFDPDVTSGSDFNFKIDGFRYPPFRTLTGQVEIHF